MTEFQSRMGLRDLNPQDLSPQDLGRHTTGEAKDITAGPRAVLSTAAEVLFLVGCSVLGPDRVPTAKGNAWEAVCADRKRARIRADVARCLSR